MALANRVIGDTYSALLERSVADLVFASLIVVLMLIAAVYVVRALRVR